MKAAASFALFVTLGSQAATAQDAAATPPDSAAPAATCELHVWPATGLSLTRQRAGDNVDTSYMSGAIGGMFATSGRERIENNTANVGTSGPVADTPLDPDDQIKVLREANLPALLGVTDYRPVYHDTALDKRTLRSEQGRYDRESAAPCYADLVLADVVYSREYANGQNVKAFVRFRDFGGEATPVRRYATWIQTDLEHDREKAEAPEAEMDAELTAGLATNLKKFAELLKARP